MTTATERRVTCRYLRRGAAGQCTAEAADPEAEVLLCTRHLSLAMELLKGQIFTTTTTEKRKS